ncbi:MAG: 2-oxo acid dehydrogenase subunit E2 [Ferruginibacter sp.]
MAVLQTIKVPLLSVNDTHLTVQELNYSNGAKVNAGDTVLVFETSKTAYDVLADVDGYINYECIAGNEYEVGKSIAKISDSPVEVPVSNAEPITSKLADNNIWEGKAIFAQAAKELMKKHHLLEDVFAGKDFVSYEDVQQHLGITTSTKKNSELGFNIETALQKIIQTDKVLLEKLSSNKQKEIKYLSSVQSSNLISTVHIAIELDGLFDRLNAQSKVFKDALLPVIIYESARLLKRYPILNSYFTGTDVAFYNDVNIGFAADIGKGLKVLKIANTETVQMQDVELQMLALSERYLDDKLTIDDLSDITFTITDLSNEGISFFHPLINMMNSAILGISAPDHKLNRIMLSLAFDHRLTEGKLASNFLQELKLNVESYALDKSFRKSNLSCYKCMKKLSEDLSSVGFVRCVTKDGSDGFICQSCLKGF